MIYVVATIAAKPCISASRAVEIINAGKVEKK